MIACILPTRGLVFTKVEEALERERTFNDIKIYRSWDLPIPDGHNYLTGLALKDEKILGKFTHFWYVEEDTVPPVNAVNDLIETDSDISFIDYAVNGWSCSAKSDETKEYLWCGLGCTLVKRHVFDKMVFPYFKIDQMLRLNDWQWIKSNPKKTYGGQDIWFCCQARDGGFKIAKTEGECEHLTLDRWNISNTNNGLHEIKQKLQIQKYQIMKEGDRDGQL